MKLPVIPDFHQYFPVKLSPGSQICTHNAWHPISSSTCQCHVLTKEISHCLIKSWHSGYSLMIEICLLVSIRQFLPEPNMFVGCCNQGVVVMQPNFPRFPISMGLFGRLKIWVFKCEETKNLENHRSEDRRSEGWQLEDVKFAKSED